MRQIVEWCERRGIRHTASFYEEQLAIQVKNAGDMFALWRAWAARILEPALVSLGMAAFLAVYREGFETVLFYKALFISAGPGSAAAPVPALRPRSPPAVAFDSAAAPGERAPKRPPSLRGVRVMVVDDEPDARDLIERIGAKRVLIDSLSDLQYAAPDPVRFREFVYSLTQRLSRAGVSSIMTSEIPDLFHVGRLAVGHKADAGHAPAAAARSPSRS